MIRFKMFRINIEQFAILTDSLSQNSVVIETALGIRHAIADRKIAVDMTFNFNAAEKRIMLLKLTCEFEIHHDDWDSFKNKDNSVVLSKEILEYFAAQTVGTARGVLHCKTEGTPFNAIILPPMDVTKMIKEDITIYANN